MVINQKLKEKAKNAARVIGCTGVIAMNAASTVFANGFNMEEIEIDPSNVDATTIMGRLLGIISGIFIVIGLFRCGTAIFSILEAYSEDNSAAINKGVKQLAIGAAFIAAPLLMKFLFS